MAVGINVDPDQQTNNRGLLGALGTLFGAGAGALVPGAGFATIAAGAGIGGGAGNTVGGIADANSNSNKDMSGQQGLQIGGGTAIQRRLTQSNDSPFSHVTDALNVVAKLPLAAQKQVAPYLMAAYQKGYPSLGVNTNLSMDMGGIN